VRNGKRGRRNAEGGTEKHSHAKACLLSCSDRQGAKDAKGTNDKVEGKETRQFLAFLACLSER